MKLYIGNLSYETNENELRTLFSEIGEVMELRLITDKNSGRSKGFAFVEFEDSKSGGSAIDRLNGYSLNGREMKISEAREKQNDDRGNRRNRRY